MEHILSFALVFLPSLLVFAWLTRPKGKVESVTELPQEPEQEPHIYYLKSLNVSPTLSFSGRLSDKDAETLQSWLTIEGQAELNEDTRPIPACRHDDVVDSFDYEELWEAAAQIPRESETQKAQINSWEAQAFKDAGEGDYL